MRLMIACPVTDEPVPTGIETEQEWRTRFPGVPSTLDPCPACGEPTLGSPRVPGSKMNGAFTWSTPHSTLRTTRRGGAPLVP